MISFISDITQLGKQVLDDTWNSRRNLCYAFCPSYFTVFPYCWYYSSVVGVGAGRPEPSLKASEMVYTPKAIIFDEGDTIDDGRHILPHFPFDAVTKSTNSSILHLFVRYAGGAVESQRIIFYVNLQMARSLDCLILLMPMKKLMLSSVFHSSIR